MIKQKPLIALLRKYLTSFNLYITSERQHADMILNAEQLPNINRTFGAGASWLEYETTSSRGTSDIGTLSPRNLKPKERPISSKAMTPLSASLFLDSNDPNAAYASSSLYNNPHSAEDQHQSQRLDRFSGSLSNDGMSNRGTSHAFGPHSGSAGNVFLSPTSQYDYSDEFIPHISGGGGTSTMNNALSSSPIWYQNLSSREGLGSGEELSPYDLSPRQTNSQWTSFSHNQCTDHPLTNIGLYSNIEAINDDTSLELAQRVLQYPISNDGSHSNSGSARVQENGISGGSIQHENCASENRLQHGTSHQSAHMDSNPHQSHAWKEVENQLMTNNKCINIPGGGTLQALHPMAPGQRSVSRTSIYSNNSSTSDRGSPSMAMLSNFDPTNPSMPVQVNVSAGNHAGFSQGISSNRELDNERASLEPVGNSRVQPSSESFQGMSLQFGTNGVRSTRAVNPTLTHNMDELEIISTVSSESNPLSTDQNIASNISELQVSNLGDGAKKTEHIKRTESTD